MFVVKDTGSYEVILMNLYRLVAGFYQSFQEGKILFSLRQGKNKLFFSELNFFSRATIDKNNELWIFYVHGHQREQHSYQTQQPSTTQAKAQAQLCQCCSGVYHLPSSLSRQPTPSPDDEIDMENIFQYRLLQTRPLLYNSHLYIMIPALFFPNLICLCSFSFPKMFLYVRNIC